MLTTKYTISATVNLNESVITHNSCLGFKASTLNSTSGAVTNYNFPVGSNQVSCGNIIASGTDVSISGGLNGKINVNVDSSGIMTSNVVIGGDGFVSTANEDLTKAQYVYWTDLDSEPSLTATSPDSLVASYTAVNYETQYATLISNIESDYSGNMISRWTFNIPRIDPSVDSYIQVYAKQNKRLDASGNLIGGKVFIDGEQIVLQTAFLYSVSITDINNEQVIIVPPTQIYALLKHKDEAQAMNT